MALTVRTNVASGNSLNQLNKTSRALSRSFERISSGKRISRAADDAAGLGVADNLRAGAASAVVAGRNTNDGISLIAVAEGAASQVGSLLTRARELAIQSASETLESTERAYTQTEFASITAEIDRIAAVTEFNGKLLGDGSVTAVNVQVGIRDTADDQIAVTLGDLTASVGLGLGAATLSTAGGATTALGLIDAAINTISGYRADYGSVENRLGSALENLGTFQTTTLEAESRIRDADFGYETAALSQNQILQQAGVSILAQANQINQSALSLLQ